MIARVIAKLLGGIWKTRQLYLAANYKVTKTLFSLIYSAALKDKGSWISLSTTFKGEPCFPHGPYGIYISGGAVIGKNCIMFQHITVGSNTLIDSGGIGAPTIGDNCYIGVGAKIIGNIRIGNNVRIGANTFVYQDISDNSVVTCASPRIVQMKRRLNNNFYQRHKGDWEYFDDGTWIKVQDKELIAQINRNFVN